MNVKCPINDSVKIHFITDVVNGYFSKNVGSGRREFSHPTMVISKQLQNGRDAIRIKPSQSNAQLTIGQIIPFIITIFHKDKEKFRQEIKIKITKPIPIEEQKTEETKKEEKKETKEEGKKKKKKQTGFFLKHTADGSGEERIDPPHIIGVSKAKNPKKWKEHFGNGKEMKGAVFFQKGNKISAIVNLSHPTLMDVQNKSRGNPKREAKRHTHAVGLIPWALYILQSAKERNYFEIQDDPEKQFALTDFMETAADAIAFFGVDFLDKIRRK